MKRSIPDKSAKELHDEAWALYLENRYAQAKRVLVKSISQNPDHAPSHLLLGQIHFFSHRPNYEAATKEFKQVIQLAPAWEEGHLWLGSTVDQNGDIDTAILCFREAIRLAPEDSRPRIALGNCLLLRGELTEAIEMLKGGLELEPYCTEADVRCFLAEALVKSGYVEQACVEWRRVLEIEDGYPSYGEPQKEARKMIAKYCS